MGGNLPNRCLTLQSSTMCWKMPARVLLSWIEARLAWSIAPHKKNLAKSHKPWTKSLAPQDITASIYFALLFIVTTNQGNYQDCFFLLLTYEMIGRLQNYELSSKTNKTTISVRQTAMADPSAAQ